ncbi:hypothetical protein [Achromobacter insolitus]|uniref:Lipoprotein n=1 Tax=Achromobacter insolitus TaxID=217204 RepID=A0A6S7F9J6_9BURK|nr:hypothetical protein [Achromobacter insolitus]CAB3931802.1 hypothetical protein LMG6000_02336 [Achromobacter insolitus]CAB3939750.1 hypothetical protein LMG5997_04153 [Achromobacter insolitus]
MSMSMILRGFLRLGAVLMLSVTLAACGGDDGDDGDSDSGTDPGTGQPETPKPEPVKPELRCAP